MQTRRSPDKGLTPASDHSPGIVRAIAYRSSDGDAMHELSECVVAEKRGLVLENRPHGKREITLLSHELWDVVCNELGAELHWHIRRANLLIAGVDLAACIGRALTIGPVRVWIHGETRPCQLMDDQHNGLREALKPGCRGGVHGQVISGGTIRVGDTVRLDPDERIGDPTPPS